MSYTEVMGLDAALSKVRSMLADGATAVTVSPLGNDRFRVSCEGPQWSMA